MLLGIHVSAFLSACAQITLQHISCCLATGMSGGIVYCVCRAAITAEEWLIMADEHTQIANQPTCCPLYTGQIYSWTGTH